MKNKRILWKICVTAVFLIAIITYSPLIIKTGKVEPFLFGLPFALWTSIGLTILVVGLTFLGGLVLPNDEEGIK